MIRYPRIWTATFVVAIAVVAILFTNASLTQDAFVSLADPPPAVATSLPIDEPVVLRVRPTADVLSRVDILIDVVGDAGDSSVDVRLRDASDVVIMSESRNGSDFVAGVPWRIGLGEAADLSDGLTIELVSSSEAQASPFFVAHRTCDCDAAVETFGTADRVPAAWLYEYVPTKAQRMQILTDRVAAAYGDSWLRFGIAAAVLAAVLVGMAIIAIGSALNPWRAP